MVKNKNVLSYYVLILFSLTIFTSYTHAQDVHIDIENPDITFNKYNKNNNDIFEGNYLDWDYFFRLNPDNSFYGYLQNEENWANLRKYEKNNIAYLTGRILYEGRSGSITTTDNPDTQEQRLAAKWDDIIIRGLNSHGKDTLFYQNPNSNESAGLTINPDDTFSGNFNIDNNYVGNLRRYYAGNIDYLTGRILHGGHLGTVSASDNSATQEKRLTLKWDEAVIRGLESLSKDSLSYQNTAHNESASLTAESNNTFYGRFNINDLYSGYFRQYCADSVERLNSRLSYEQHTGSISGFHDPILRKDRFVAKWDEASIVGLKNDNKKYINYINNRHNEYAWITQSASGKTEGSFFKNSATWGQFTFDKNNSSGNIGTLGFVDLENNVNLQALLTKKENTWSAAILENDFTLITQYNNLSRLLDVSYNSETLLQAILGSTGELHGKTAGGNMAADIAWTRGSGTLRTGIIKLNGLVADFSGSDAKFNNTTNIAGLYHDSYIIEVEGYPTGQIEDNLKETFSNYKAGHISKDIRNQFIKGSLKEIRINTRELGDHLTLGDPKWDDVIHSLAIDLKEVKLSSENCIDIIDADKPQDKLWELFNALNENDSGAIKNKYNASNLFNGYMRILSRDLGNSIGGHAALNNSGSFFNSYSGYKEEYQNAVIGQDYGRLALDLPLFLESYSSTHLLITAPANRLWWKFDSGQLYSYGNTFSLEGLFYVYSFDEKIGFAVNNNGCGAGPGVNFFKDEFLLNNNLLYEQRLDDTYFLPGARFAFKTKNDESGWYINNFFYPYLPIEIEPDSYNIKLAANQDSGPADKVKQVKFAYETEAGIEKQFCGRYLGLQLKKDVNDILEITPSFEAFPHLKLGNSLYLNESPDSTNHAKWVINSDLFKMDSQIFLENDKNRGLMRYGASLAGPLKENNFDVWLARLNWQNADAWQVCEDEIGLSFYKESCWKLLSRVRINQQTDAYSWLSQGQAPLFNLEDTYMSISAQTQQNSSYEELDTMLSVTTLW